MRQISYLSTFRLLLQLDRIFGSRLSVSLLQPDRYSISNCGAQSPDRPSPVIIVPDRFNTFRLLLQLDRISRSPLSVSLLQPNRFSFSNCGPHRPDRPKPVIWEYDKVSSLRRSRLIICSPRPSTLKTEFDKLMDKSFSSASFRTLTKSSLDIRLSCK